MLCETEYWQTSQSAEISRIKFTKSNERSIRLELLKLGHKTFASATPVLKRDVRNDVWKQNAENITRGKAHKSHMFPDLVFNKLILIDDDWSGLLFQLLMSCRFYR